MLIVPQFNFSYFNAEDADIFTVCMFRTVKIHPFYLRHQFYSFGLAEIIAYSNADMVHGHNNGPHYYTHDWS